MPWLTARELSSELHCSIPTITTLRQKRRLTYINIGTIKCPQFRYQIPPHTPAQLIPEIERIGLLTYDEVGSILGINRDTVRQMAKRRKIKTVGTSGNRRTISIAEFRRWLAERDKRSGQTKQSYSPILVEWLKSYLKTREIPVQVLDKLIREAATVPTDKRSGYITKLWNLFDQVNAILREIEQERNGRGTGN